MDLKLTNGDFVNSYYDMYLHELEKSMIQHTYKGHKLRLFFMDIDPIDQEYTYTGLTESTYQALVENPKVLPELIDEIEYDQLYIARDGIVIFASKTKLT